MNTRVLVVDDDAIVAESLAQKLADTGYDTITAHDSRQAFEAIADASRCVNVLVTDVNLPGGDGLSLLRELRDRRCDVVPVVVTGFGRISDAVEAIKLGAVDYLTKPVVDAELLLAVAKAAQQQALLAENTSLRERLDERFGIGCLLGADPRMLKVYDLIEAVADTRTSVLITGEAGTGKSLVARALHQIGSRSKNPFVDIDLNALSEPVQQRELFGYVKGAFDGADGDYKGRLASASGGTLLIDGIESASPALQHELMTMLQERRYRAVGSSRLRTADARFIFSSREHLAARVRDGLFRDDLYARLQVVHLALPALRERRGDVPLLAEHFVERHCEQLGRDRRLSNEAMELLERHDWPGNVRELEHAIEHAVVVSRHYTLGPDDLPSSIRQPAVRDVSHTSAHADALPVLEQGWTPMPLADALLEPERRILLAALQANGWNRNETARQLDINRTTLYKKIRQFGLSPE